MWNNSQSGISEEAGSSKVCYSDSDGNESSAQRSHPECSSLEFDSVVETNSTKPINCAVETLSIRDRLNKEGKQNQDGRKQETKQHIEMKNIDDLSNRICLDSEPSIPEVPVIKKYASTYELEKYKKNTMIIFNHKDFLGGDNTRLGTMQDEEALKTTFEMFNFVVEPHLNLDKKTLLQKLKQFCSKDFREYGCVCVAVLTHGSKYGYLKAYDRRYTEHEIIECFDVQNNLTLFGKPIIILIQACRGDEPATACYPGTPKSKDIELDSDDHCEIPIDCNMLVFHSSYVGRASARDVLKGSWFIQTLCEQIKLLAAVEDFETICRAVKQEVALNKQHKMTVNNKQVIVKQMPVVTSTLVRLLYLRKYEDNTEDDLNPEEQFVKEKKDIKIDAENAQEKINLCSNITSVQDTYPMFQQLHDAAKWCKEKLRKLHDAEYGSDLLGVQRELDLHQREHKQISQFHLKIKQCVDNRAGFSGEELALYSQHLSMLQKLYYEMQFTSVRRISELESLKGFLREREQMKLTQDWANPSTNSQRKFSNVIDRGAALIAQHHPATKTIEAYLKECVPPLLPPKRTVKHPHPEVKPNSEAHTPVPAVSDPPRPPTPPPKVSVISLKRSPAPAHPQPLTRLSSFRGTPPPLPRRRPRPHTPPAQTASSPLRAPRSPAAPDMHFATVQRGQRRHHTHQ